MTVELREITLDDPDLRAALLEHTLPLESNGYATEAVSATRAFVQQRLPDVKRVVLTVNHRNPAAIATYPKGGFVKSVED